MFLNAALLWIVRTNSYYSSAIILSGGEKKQRAEEKRGFQRSELEKKRKKVDVNHWKDMYENASAEQYQSWGRGEISRCHSVFPVYIGMESS